MSETKTQLTSSKRKLESSNTSDQKRKKVVIDKYDLESNILSDAIFHLKQLISLYRQF